MGIKKKKYKIGRKEFLTILGIGLTLIIISFGSLSYISKKSAENTFYKLSSNAGKINPIFKGLSLKFKKEDISCSGIVTFNCEIKDPIIWAPSLGIDLFTAKKIKIGEFSKNGFIIGRKINFNLNIEKLNISNTHPYIEKISKNGKKIKEELFPLNLDLKLNSILKSNSESKIYVKVMINNKIIKTSIEGNFLNILENSLYKNNAPSSKIVTILKFFKIKIKNKNIENFIYNLYLYYFDLAKTNSEKEKINLLFFNNKTINKLSIINVKSQIIKKLDILNKNKTTGVYSTMIESFLEKKNSLIIIEGQNKDNYVFKSRKNLEKEYIEQIEHFNIKIKTGDNL